MNTPPLLPPQSSVGSPHDYTPTALNPKGRPLAIASVVVGAIGILPLLVYFISCIGHFESAYRTGGNPLLILAMGFIGFVIHGIGLICGIIGVCMACKKLSLLGLIGNSIILCAILLLGFIAIAGS